jgi:hypothetical protein
MKILQYKHLLVWTLTELSDQIFFKMLLCQFQTIIK